MRTRPVFLFSLLFAVALPAFAQSSALRIVSVSPASQATSASMEEPIEVVFNEAIDPATFTASNVMVFGRWSGVIPCTFEFLEGNTRIRFQPLRSFSAGEWVTVALSRHVGKADGTTLDKGYTWNFWTQTVPASLDLQPPPETLPIRRSGDREGWIQSYGAYAGDLNLDGFTDFAVPNERTNDVRVFLNDGAGGYGAFTIHPIPGGARPSTNEGADFNLDGIIDFAVGNSANDQVTVFYGTGSGNLVDPTSFRVGSGVRGLSVLDLNGDGYMDIATANRDGSNVSLLLNDSGTRFLPGGTLEGGGASAETAAAAADANNDGILDLFVGAYGSNEMVVFLGDGEGGLTYHTKVSAGGPSWMIAVGDVNGDGNVDVASANSDANNVAILLGDGHGNLMAPTTYNAGLFPLAVELGDLDGDGDLDLVTSNFRSSDWAVYENLGDGTFDNRRRLLASQAGSCAVLHDRDNNGTLDLTGIDELDDLLFLFTNPAQPSVSRETAALPATAFRLEPGYPNPFSETVTLSYTLPHTVPLELAVYDVLGRKVRVLAQTEQAAGTHQVQWDGEDAQGRLLAHGTYFIRMQAHTQVYTQEVLLIRSAQADQ